MCGRNQPGPSEYQTVTFPSQREKMVSVVSLLKFWASYSLRMLKSTQSRTRRYAGSYPYRVIQTQSASFHSVLVTYKLGYAQLVFSRHGLEYPQSLNSFLNFFFFFLDCLSAIV